MTTIYNADCIEIMRQLPDNSIDCVVTDCPYHITAGGVSLKPFKECGGVLQKRAVSDGTACSNKGLKKDSVGIPCAVKNGKMFEHNDIEFEEWLPEVYRVLKEGTHCYVMINGRNLKELQQKAEAVGFKFLNLLAWKKNNQTPNKYYMQCLEFILLLRKGRAKNINNLGSSNCLEVENIIGKKVHPTEKPVQLMYQMIVNSSDEGETILDPFMGGGSTGMACVKAKRNFIGIEIDKGYFDVAKKRIEEAEREQKESMALFEGAL